MEHDALNFSAGLLATSRAFGWQGLLVQTHRHNGGEFSFPAFDDHLISLHLGAPISLERGQNGSRLRCEPITRGAAVFVPAGQSTFWRHREATYYLNLHISCDLLDQTAAQTGFKSGSALCRTYQAAFHDPQVQQIALLLQTEMEDHAPHGLLYVEMLASALCVHLLHREHGQRRQSPPAPAASGVRPELRQAASYIQDNLSADLSLASIAREAGLSACYLARLFTEAFGIPPHQFVIQARIERAKALMTHGGLAPGEAARHTGFSDQSHFTRHFKRLVGVTPRTFALNHHRNKR